MDYKVKGLLDMSGLGNVWLEQEHVNVNWLKSALELRLLISRTGIMKSKKIANV